jgi:hypothetical protein
MFTRHGVHAHNTETTAVYPPVERQASPFFAPPQPSMSREPSTPYGTYWHAPTPAAGASNPRMQKGYQKKRYNLRDILHG